MVANHSPDKRYELALTISTTCDFSTENFNSAKSSGLDAVEIMPAIRAFMMPYWQVPAGVDPHMLAAAFRTPKPDILQDLLLAGLPPTVRFGWQFQVRQIIQKKGIFHESGPYGQIQPL